MKTSLTEQKSEYLQALRQSGLVTTECLEGLQAQGVLDADSIEELSERLFKLHVLTPWQHARLLEGRLQGFYIGDYKIQEFVSKGGMSAMVTAMHRRTTEQVTLKLLLPALAQKASFLERFRKEMDAAKSIDHANVLHVFECGSAEYPGVGELHFLVTEHVEGSSLMDLLESTGPLPLQTAVEYVAQTAAGLDHIHQRGLVHRNLKPSNIWLDEDGIIKVTSLSVARFLDEEDAESLTLQHDQEVVGTVEYMAPEQLVDSHNIDPRADIYSLGCVLYFLLTGSHRYVPGTTTARMMRMLNEPPPPFGKYRDDITPPVEEICFRMMAKSPNDRYQTAAEVVTALRPHCTEGRIDLFDPQEAGPRRTDTKIMQSMMDAARDESGSGTLDRETVQDFLREYGE